MTDRYNHPDGVKAQDVDLVGEKLKKKGVPAEGVVGKRQKEMAEQATETAPQRTAGERQPGVSGYLKSKKSAIKALEEAGNI